MKYINLDHISSNPLLPEVKQAMIAAIQHDYHNPSSQHRAGEEAAAPRREEAVGRDEKGARVDRVQRPPPDLAAAVQREVFALRIEEPEMAEELDGITGDAVGPGSADPAQIEENSGAAERRRCVAHHGRIPPGAARPNRSGSVR